LNGTDRAVDGRRVRSPLVAERHVLLKADKVITVEKCVFFCIYAAHKHR